MQESDNKLNEPSSCDHLEKLIKGIEFAMLTHADAEGNLVSRPMAMRKLEESTLWFFASDESFKSRLVEGGRPVNVSFSEPKDHRYVSLSGEARLNHDRRKMEEIWSPTLNAWFTKGLEDPHLCLIEVQIDRAEFWDASKGKMVQFWNLLKALATGSKVEKLGDHDKLSMH